MDATKLQEIDSPYTLLQNESNSLSQLVKKTGAAGGDFLTNLAKEVRIFHH